MQKLLYYDANITKKVPGYFQKLSANVHISTQRTENQLLTGICLQKNTAGIYI